MRLLLTPIVLIIWFGALAASAEQRSLRFYGNGVAAPDLDRVKIRIDDPANTDPGPPADIGAGDFTIEFWMHATGADNPSPQVDCGSNINWIYGNIILDRDRYNQDRKFGVSVAGGRVVFGVSGEETGDFTICSSSGVLDDNWHHIALQRRRSDGMIWLYVDGQLEAMADGPDGDISYPDDGIPGNHCGGPCVNSDPFLVIGAEKHDAGAAYPSYRGLFDELRLSTSLRYSSSFTPSSNPFTTDDLTAALYHFDEGAGDTLFDVSGVVGGPSHGIRRYGGSPAGPIWSNDSPFASAAPDGDSDGITDSLDNCPATFNPDQADSNSNGIGDACELICGDADNNSLVTISDAVYLITYIFGGGPPPNSIVNGDADCNGLITISDAVYLITYIFGGGQSPCAACP